MTVTADRATREAGEAWTYRRVLRGGRLPVFLAGDLVSNLGDGMLLSALPLLALRVRGETSAAVAVSLVESAPYVLGTAFAFAVGLSKARIPPRALVVCDCLLRSALFTGLGVLALCDRLTLVPLVLALLCGSVLRMTALSSRRLIATAQVDPAGRLAVNSLLGTTSNLALYAAGPFLGGVLAAATEPGWALVFDGVSFLVLLGAVRLAVPPRAGSVEGTTLPASGWSVLGRVPVAARLFVVVFCFNLFYMPVEVALPLLVDGGLGGSGTALGVIWGGFGVGALVGAMATNALRALPQQRLLVGVIALWALVPGLLALAPSVPVAAVVFFVGGVVYAPFVPVVYTFVQSVLDPAEQQPVLTLWAAGSALAGPVGLLLAGPLVVAAGTRGALLVSTLLTLALVPLAGARLRDRRSVPAPRT
ncbi:MFS transporter [Streptomyces sp. NPDC090106]|uniref:MFS transporter n=1 Tax=Streptomyces sp. NPDC090106 TaxID=3365946 RepID=UPI0037F6D6BC